MIAKEESPTENEDNILLKKKRKLDEEDRGPRSGADVFRKIYFDKQQGKDGVLPYINVVTPFEGTSCSLKKYYGPREEDESDEEGHEKPGRKGKRKRYTFQFKMAVIKEQFRTTSCRAADKYGLTLAQVSQWRKKYIKEGPQAFLMRGKRGKKL